MLGSQRGKLGSLVQVGVVHAKTIDVRTLMEKRQRLRGLIECEEGGGNVHCHGALPKPPEGRLWAPRRVGWRDCEPSGRQLVLGLARIHAVGHSSVSLDPVAGAPHTRFEPVCHLYCVVGGDKEYIEKLRFTLQVKLRILL